jgi:nucleoside-diphosphate-sugar epimerase
MEFEFFHEKFAMKILLTGATGFIGKHLANALLARGHQVVVGARNIDKARHHPWQDKVELLQVDIGDPVADLFEHSGRPDALLHAAWDKLGDYRSPAHFEDILFKHYGFISALVRQGLSQCMVLGTCLEYGMQEGALHEEMECKPILAYPLAKHLLHQMLQGLQLSSSFTLQWARLFYTYGSGQRASSLLAQLDTAIDNGAEIFNMSPGDQLRDYLPVETLAMTLASIVARRDFDGSINCCSGSPVSVKELVEMRIRERGASIRTNPGHYPYPTYEPLAFWGDTTRLRQVLANGFALDNHPSKP